MNKRRENADSTVDKTGLLTAREWERHWSEFAHDFLPLARRLVGETIAEDAMQETYLRVWSLLPSYEMRWGKRGLFGWMQQVLRNVCREQARQEAKHRHVSADANLLERAGGKTDDATAATALVSVLREEDGAAFLARVAAANLSERQRACLMARWHNLPSRTVAAELGLTRNAVRAHIAVAIRKIEGKTRTVKAASKKPRASTSTPVYRGSVYQGRVRMGSIRRGGSAFKPIVPRRLPPDRYTLSLFSLDL